VNGVRSNAIDANTMMNIILVWMVSGGWCESKRSLSRSAMFDQMRIISAKLLVLELLRVDDFSSE
jgi:hypothetical protein